MTEGKTKASVKVGTDQPWDARKKSPKRLLKQKPVSSFRSKVIRKICVKILFFIFRILPKALSSFMKSLTVTMDVLKPGSISQHLSSIGFGGRHEWTGPKMLSMDIRQTDIDRKLYFTSS